MHARTHARTHERWPATHDAIRTSRATMTKYLSSLHSVSLCKRYHAMAWPCRLLRRRTMPCQARLGQAVVAELDLDHVKHVHSLH
ncbi:hypothetical protein LZ31DRAFT_160357 [Colletotrichum somersetense]|nr:hypothetical protein LZ31DRAFT_160357 [Colletotrichum somersetense]